MATEEYRNYLAWEEAISLSQQVHGLIESLPSDEQSALAVSLNTSSVRIPTNVALNLMLSQPADISAIVSLQIELELINRIYPALDAAELTEAASALLDRLQDVERFRETLPQPLPAAETEAEVDDDEDLDEEDDEEPEVPTRVNVQS